MRRRQSSVLVCAVSLALPVLAQTLTGKVATEFRIHQRKAPPRAFATNGADAWGYFYDATSLEVARDYALKSCEASRAKARSKTVDLAPCQVIDVTE